MQLHGPTRLSPADGMHGHAKSLDEMLLHHRESFGRDAGIATDTEDIQCRGRSGIPLPQEYFGARADGAVENALMVARAASSFEHIHQTTIPARCRMRPRCGKCL